MRFTERPLRSVAELMELLGEDQKTLATSDLPAGRIATWYRGVPNVDFTVIPSMYRPKSSLDGKNERFMMDRFKQNAHQFLDTRPQGEWEWLFLMRHHGLPSRLLDWTESPLVALYFALFDVFNPRRATLTSDVDGALWCLLPSTLNQLMMASQPTNLPMFSDERDRELEVADVSGLYRPSRINWDSSAPIPPLAGICIRTTRRIQAQHGVFTIHHVSRTPIEDIAEGQHIWRFIIPKDNKSDLAHELRRLYVNELSVFPRPRQCRCIR